MRPHWHTQRSAPGMRSLLFAAASVATVALLGACAQPAVEEETQASEDLLVTDDGLGRDVEVSADALTVTRTGHESLLELPAGKLIVGRRGGAKNPDGFLRRVSSVTTDGSKIGSSDMSLGPREFGGLLGGKIDISNAVVLDERDIAGNTGAVSASGVKLAAHAEVTSGYIDFRPLL